MPPRARRHRAAAAAAMPKDNLQHYVDGDSLLGIIQIILLFISHYPISRIDEYVPIIFAAILTFLQMYLVQYRRAYRLIYCARNAVNISIWFGIFAASPFGAIIFYVIEAIRLAIFIILRSA
ncbi:unnamed protein product [Caenorhabditis bovis]|uniref:Uncharacterized protein n=1 Tax=Caenorhabditis bovis TaxID=2654633 RepID=A0A8S1EYY4_9PELO|nr:unnamed protein product [Caenorhabditis bovis]